MCVCVSVCEATSCNIHMVDAFIKFFPSFSSFIYFDEFGPERETGDSARLSRMVFSFVCDGKGLDR